MAATLLDTFAIALGFDTTGLQKGQKDAKDALDKTGAAATKAQKELDQAAKRTAESYKKIRDGILEVTAAIVGAVAGKEFLAYITANDIAVGRLSKNLGVATEEISAWEGVARRLGGNGSDADSLFRGVNKMMEDFKLNGGSGSFSPLVRAGLDLSKFMDKSTTYTQRLLMMRDAMQKLSGPDAQRLGQMAGFSEEGLNILVQTDRALEQMLETQRKMNMETDADRKNALDRNEAWTDLTETMTGFGRKVAGELTPLLDGPLHELRDMFLFFEDHIPTAITLITALAGSMLLLKGYALSVAAASTTGIASTVLGGASTALGTAGVVGLAGAAGYGVGAILNHFGLSDWLADFYSGPGPSMAGGYVPGTKRGLPQGASGGDPLGIRNNNPGNLNFVGQGGASQAGRFAAFGSMAEGIAAMDDQLRLYASRGNDTVRGIVSKWAPPGENNTESYVDDVSKRMGVNPDAHLNFAQEEIMRGMLGGLINHEVGPGRINADQINAGMALSMSRSGAGGNFTMGDLHVHPKSGDPKEIARETTTALRNFKLASQASTGVN